MSDCVTRNAALLIHTDDNILVACMKIDAGEGVDIDGSLVIAPVSIEVGHKIARRDMAAGTKIIRYGAPIGSLTRAVRRGDHVHSHNLKSDYIPSHDRHAVDLSRN